MHPNPIRTAAPIGSVLLLPVRPLYVLVAGGIAAGKNHVVQQHLHGIPVMDVDDVMQELGFTDYDGPDYRQAIVVIAERIATMMAARRSLVAMGTAANLGFTVDRLHSAKMAGYTTVLLHIDAPVEQALAQNEERRRKGKRAVPPHQIDRIAATCAASARTVEALRGTLLVDHHVHHPNRR